MDVPPVRHRREAVAAPAGSKLSPRLEAHCLGRLFFWWLRPLLDRGSDDLGIDDLHDVLPDDKSERLGNRLEKYWKNEVECAKLSNRKPQLVKAIWNTFGWSYSYYAVYMLLLSSLRVLQPFMLGRLIRYFEYDSQTTRSEAYGFASGIVLLILIHSLMKHHIDLCSLEIGMRLRIACSSLIIRKMLRLSSSSVSDGNIGGRLINLLTNDVARFDSLFLYLHYIWITPVQGLIIAYLGWSNVQGAALAGILLMVLATMPVQAFIGKITLGLRERIATRTDERVRLMAGILSGVSVIKMYTWEKPFQRLVSLARRHEIGEIALMSYLRGINTASNAFVDRTCLYLALVAHVLAGNPVTAEKVFSLVQYFGLLQNLLIYNYPRAIFNAAEARVSIKRVEKFLMMDEIQIEAPLLSVEENASISLRNVTASWSPNSIVNTLHKITMNIVPKKLHVIIGPVGSGKTSLIQMILGELRASKGKVRVNGTVSYAGQRAWLFPGSLRGNIVFDQVDNEERFREVVRVCALERDLARLPRGERAQVADRGTNLSGGQCARVNLARAVYKDADIYIFDDPFAAVDASICKYLFNECINGYLKDKTRIFVTHHVQCLKEADAIFLVNNGILESHGRYADLSNRDIKFLNILEKDEKELPEIVECIDNTESNDLDNILQIYSNGKNEEGEHEERGELIVKGTMKTSIFLHYFVSGNSYFLIITTILLFILAQIIRSGSDYWLAYWTHEEELRLKGLVNGNISKPSNFTMNVTKSTLANLTEATAAILLPYTTQSPLTSTMESLLTYATEKPLLTTITEHFVSITTEASSPTTTQLPTTTGSSRLNTTLNSIANSTENFLSETNNLIATVVPTFLPTTNESLESNATASYVSSTMKNLLSAGTVRNVLLGAAENLMLSATDIFQTNATINSTPNGISNSTTNVKRSLDVSNSLKVNTALIIYGLILLACIVTALSKCLLFFKACMNASKDIHNEMLTCVLRAPIRFFDQQSSGQILNRFSKDTGAMDEILPNTMYESIEVFFIILGIIVQVLMVNSWCILPMIVTGITYWKIRKLFLPTAYKLKRIEGAEKSPVLSYATSMLEGLVTIRSSRAQRAVRRRFDALQDSHTRAHFLGIAVASAFGLWLDLVSVVLVGFVTFGCLVTGNIFAGAVGLAITQILMLCGMLQRGIRQTAESVVHMASVERVLQFTELENENPEEGAKPAIEWPSRGKIELRNLSVRYGEDEDPVLKNVSLVIESGTKVGIVGRTGAGKSSLISALFRMSRLDGQLLIDDVDASVVSLTELRRRLAIIPQEPALFAASLRDNLDPCHGFEDTQLWLALEEAKLHNIFVPLDHPIECGGRILSTGQRQLLCLARVLLKKARILVLDEATANVDPATDALIRKTIRARFHDCTVLTVAHRLESVIDNDRVVVVENGEVVEYDHPYLLLNRKDGHLARMARQAGNAKFEHLKQVAEKAYERLNEEVSTTDTDSVHMSTEISETTNSNEITESSSTKP